MTLGLLEFCVSLHRIDLFNDVWKLCYFIFTWLFIFEENLLDIRFGSLVQRVAIASARDFLSFRS